MELQTVLQQECERLNERAIAMEETMGTESVLVSDSKRIEGLLNEANVYIPEEAIFTGSMTHLQQGQFIRTLRENRHKEVLRANPDLEQHLNAHRLYAYTANYDFGHTAPDWQNIFTLGLTGLLDRLERAAARDRLTEKQQLYYAAGIRAYRGSIRYVARMGEQAAAMGKTEMADGLLQLTKGAPRTLYQAMQLSFLYYDLQQYAEGTNIRTLGRLDELFFPYYREDLAAGRLTKARAAELIDAYLREWNERNVQSNIPFAMGGARADGTIRINELSYLILERFEVCKLPNVKLHILYDPRLPKAWIRMALDGIRTGGNSIVFLNNSGVMESLKRVGIDHSDAEDYSVVGCYEPCGKDEIPCTCNGRINLPRAVEAVLWQGRDCLTDTRIGALTPEDFPSFEAFLDAFYEQLTCFCNGCMQLTNAKEAGYPEIHSAPFFSATYDCCVRAGADVYESYGAKYNNSSINLVGLATAVDSLIAIRTLVFEEGSLSLTELKECLRTNWAGQEPLRQRIRRGLPKYGNGNEAADRLAREIVDYAAKRINGVPNAKGGVYRMGGFSIDWRFKLGKFTAASADGRRAGETVSKNLCAAPECDRRGVTAEIRSAASLNGLEMPNGSVLDLTMHASATKGEEGLCALAATLETFMKLGGMAIQYNVLDGRTLREAQRRPEDYPNLQVRLCGWNVLFSNLSKQEQDEFIGQTEAME